MAKNSAVIVKSLCFLAAALALLAAAPRGGSPETKPEPLTLEGGVVSEDMDLRGEVVVEKDLYLPPGRRLRFGKGSVVKFRKSESTKVEPENFLGGTEITVRGHLEAEGAAFLFDGEGGIVVEGGSVVLKDSSVSGAEFGILLISGIVDTEGSEIVGSDTGIMVAGCAGDGCSLTGGAVTVRECRKGAIFPEGFSRGNLVEVVSPLESGTLFYESHFDEEGGFLPDPVGDLKAGFSPAEVIEDLFLDRDSEWEGDVLVKGVVRVAPGTSLRIGPGTRVLFDFRDTNGDGIGESGLFLQGRLVVEGTDARPVIFGSASGNGRGLWDSINFMASDLEVNRIEHAVIADSYRGLHSHFSDVYFKEVRIYRTFRGIQFQESKVRVEGLGIFDSISGLRCRDSDVEIAGLYTAGNVSGANFLRVRGGVEDLFIADNLLYGLRIRESVMKLVKGRVTGGLYSLSLQEGDTRFEGITQARSLFAGLQAQESTISIGDSTFRDNRTYGLSFRDGKYTLQSVSVTGSGVKKLNLEGSPEIIMK